MQRHLIDLPDDPDEAVRRLREELRAARRRRGLRRRAAGFARFRALPLVPRTSTPDAGPLPR